MYQKPWVPRTNLGFGGWLVKNGELFVATVTCHSISQNKIIRILFQVSITLSQAFLCIVEANHNLVFIKIRYILYFRYFHKNCVINRKKTIN